MPLVNIWRRLRREILDSYRPELYYMRGPGPRWREKHPHITSVPRNGVRFLTFSSSGCQRVPCQPSGDPHALQPPEPAPSC
jgi:hypothetical protein